MTDRSDGRRTAVGVKSRRYPPTRRPHSRRRPSNATMASAHANDSLAGARLSADGMPGRPARRNLGSRRRRRQENRLHDHGQFGGRKGGVSPKSAAGQVPVRRAGRARPAGLVGIGLPAANSLRCPGHLRPLRRRQRVLLRARRGARVSSGRRDGARVVQQFVLDVVLAVEGSLSIRLQHVESGAAERRGRRDRAKSDRRRTPARRR